MLPNERQYSRAPFKSSLLYVSEGQVYKAQTENFSEGGLLLKSLNILPKEKSFSVMMAIPKVPFLGSLSRENIFSLSSFDFVKKIFRVKVAVARSYEKKNHSYAGVFFVQTPNGFVDFANFYKNNCAKNLAYLLGLFEGRNIQGDKKSHIRQVASLLHLLNENHEDLPLSQIRLKCLHEYQSLKS